MAQEKKLNLTSVARGIESGIETADAERAKALEHLQLVRNTKAKGLTSEHARLADKYGDKHPRVIALAARIKLNEGLLSNLSAEVVRARTEIPRVDETSWVLHGFVRDLNGKPLSQLTIAPYNRADKSGVWVKELGYACTKEPGYFKIEAKGIKPGHEKIFLRALNRDGDTLFCDSQGNTPRPGGLDYREIRISGDVVECVPPPPPPLAPDVAEWTVTGRVVDTENNAVPGVTVSLSDKEEAFADRFGSTETDPAGRFTLRFRADEFKDLAKEDPELFVRVTAEELEQAITNPTALHFKAGKTEKVTVAIKARVETQKPWIVSGTVNEATGKPAPKLIVSITDKAGKFAERLGKKTTTARGAFRFAFKPEEFADLIAEKVDLFVNVSDAKQKVLFTSRALRFEPGKTETLTIALPK